MPLHRALFLPATYLAALLAAGIARADGWSDLTGLTGSDAISGRGQFGFTCTPGGDLYVAGGAGRLLVGGRRQFTLLGDVWRWTGDGRWTDITLSSSCPMPPTIEAHLATDAAGRIYEFGGVQDSLDGTFSNRLYRFTPTTHAWDDITPALSPRGREDHGWVGDTKRDLLWLFGGVTAGAEQLGDLWCYDVAAGIWRERTPAFGPEGRELYDLAWDGADALYLFGGYRDGAGYLQDFWRYDIGSGAWTDLTAASGAGAISPRSYAGMTVDANGILWLVGGYSAPAVLGGFWRYDPQEGRWADVSERAEIPGLLPRATYCLRFRPQDGGLYLFGGTLRSEDDPTRLRTASDLWRYDLHPVLGAPTPPASAPVIVASGTAVTFTAAALGVSGRALAWTWSVDGAVRVAGRDTLVEPFSQAGAHSVTALVRDGVFADTLAWSVEVTPGSSPPAPPAFTLRAPAGMVRRRAILELSGATGRTVEMTLLRPDGRPAWTGSLQAPPEGPVVLDLAGVPAGLYHLDARAGHNYSRSRLLLLP